MGVGKVTMGFTLCGGCCGCLLITTIRGQRGQEVILVQNTQIRQSKQGLAIISGRPSKPITHQGSGVPETSPGWQLVTQLQHGPLVSFARTHPGPLNMEGWSGVPQERLQTEGRVGAGTEGQSWEAWGSRTEAGDDGTHTRSFYRGFHFRGKKPGSQGR